MPQLGIGGEGSKVAWYILGAIAPRLIRRTFAAAVWIAPQKPDQIQGAQKPQNRI
jgi:hypothetical protein